VYGVDRISKAEIHDWVSCDVTLLPSLTYRYQHVEIVRHPKLFYSVALARITTRSLWRLQQAKQGATNRFGPNLFQPLLTLVPNKHITTMTHSFSDEAYSRILAKLADPDAIPASDAALFAVFNRSTRTTQYITHGPISSDHLLRLGSITKTLLAFIALKNGIPLESTVSSVLPQLDDSHFASSNEITYQHLMNHTSGIFSYTEIPNVETLAESFSPALIVDLAWKDRPLMFSPGSQWFYSNTNSEVVALTLEQKTGKTARQLFEEEFKSVAKSLTLDAGEKLNFPMQTPAYRDFKVHHTFPSASGTLIATAEDIMLAFDHMITSKLEIFDRMKSWASAPRYPDPDNPAGGQKYGLYLQEFAFGNKLAYGHDGHIGICSACFELEGSIYLIHASLEMSTEKWMKYVSSVMLAALEYV
jgi:D-alanyl-D-alanine carboxypeptidase